MSSRFPTCESTPAPRGLLVTSNFAGTLVSTHHDAALMILQRLLRLIAGWGRAPRDRTPRRDRAYQTNRRRPSHLK
jgi:hypothetical protein